MSMSADSQSYGSDAQRRQGHQSQRGWRSELEEELEPQSEGSVIPISQAAPATGPAALEKAIDAACRRIAPLWTLRNFVAVNPYLGLSELPFDAAMRETARLFHARGRMPRDFYLQQYQTGRIGEADLREAIEVIAAAGPEVSAPGAQEVEKVLDSLLDESAEEPSAAQPVQTLAEVVDAAEGSSWAQLIEDEIAKWCAGRFDHGQAAWAQPWSELAPWPAWREAARIDRNPEALGLRGFRWYAAGLPDDPAEAIASVLDQLEIPEALHADFLARQLASIAGWAGHVQWLAREAKLAGGDDDSLVHLLAIRLAFDGGLDQLLGERAGGYRTSLRDAAAARLSSDGQPGEPAAIDPLAIWQLAYERGYRRGLLWQLAVSARQRQSLPRPRLQAVFCIDVRSEILRRHLESQSTAVRTVGFAGFFGFPLEYLQDGAETGSARCPALIAPPLRLTEQAPEGSDADVRASRGRARHERFSALRKLSVASYPLVETVGHFFGLRLLTDAFGWTRPHAGGALFENRAKEELVPSTLLEARPDGEVGLSLEQQVDLAEATLRNMGLTEGFADVVLLCGHGSLSTNNPYASSLDCGACGGHAGDVNARVAAMVLDSPAVRLGLKDRGIEIPADTVFIAGLHDTSVDEVKLFDTGLLTTEQQEEIEGWLAAAGALTREERAGKLGEEADSGLSDRLHERARDWSELRPEWGLAGNAAFIAAPRSRLRGVDLGGRVFLHDYEAAADTDGSVLELVLTAPMVVASWINLQYYASTTDNEVFGSGNKALHNVVGRHGVMLGNRSDLKVGLPFQSVHDGQDWVHEPMRLTAIIEAPRDRIEAIVESHADLRELLENGWVHLLAWEPEAGVFHQFLSLEEGWMPAPVDIYARARSRGNWG